MSRREPMSTPRRKRTKRDARLQSARTKFPNPGGDRRAIRMYEQWYGVDMECAVIELRLLGAKIDEKYVSRRCESAEHARRARAKEPEELLDIESDEWHSFIAGYTEGGFSYGLTWDDHDQTLD
jgi:hypothetical protein